MAATIRDIRDRTGLSLATISKYLNGGNVLPKNRELIEKVIADVQLKVNAYLIPAYRAALQTSAKRHLRNNRGNRRRGGMEWGSGSY